MAALTTNACAAQVFRYRFMASVRFLSQNGEASMSDAPIDPLLRRQRVQFCTSAGDKIETEAVFQDTLPSGSSVGTVVAIHGAPGSHKDYKYVTPLLQQKGIRFIGVNMPGFGLTPGS
ncbi:hypothetical protein Y032_0720g1812 [Ancylostoma ceylanicum]|uniref:AB hydrolase-1 domain-containing protein n=1 Tax=Ancylostoma ceylanicum TaxID=53326 RepID=A0A016WEX3_9BILA|nr:hypothetical protein Y032_0720g1812 [Ancylostoma ceylanicum]